MWTRCATSEAFSVRVSPLRGVWELAPRGPNRTHARYVSLENLGGKLPRSVVEQTSWKQPLETFRGVRKAIADAANKK